MPTDNRACEQVMMQLVWRGRDLQGVLATFCDWEGQALHTVTVEAAIWATRQEVLLAALRPILTGELSGR